MLHYSGRIKTLLTLIFLLMVLLTTLITISPPQSWLRANEHRIQVPYQSTRSSVDDAYYISIAGTSFWKSLRTVKVLDDKVADLINKIENILFSYEWLLNQSIHGKYRLTPSEATRIILFNSPGLLYDKRDTEVKILLYSDKDMLTHDLANGLIRLGRIILPHGVEIIILAIINHDNILVSLSKGEIENMKTLKYIIYIHPYNFTRYKYFLEIHHHHYGKTPPATDTYVEKVKPNQWKWVLYKTIIVSNKPFLLLNNGTRIPLEYVAVIEEYPYTDCSTEILWSLFYRSLAFSLALNLALPSDVDEGEYFRYALKVANHLMVHKLSYYREPTMVYCITELAKIGGACYEHSLVGMEIYNLVFRLPYFMLYMRSKITGLGHSVGVVVVPSIYVNVNTSYATKNTIQYCRSYCRDKLVETGIDFDGDSNPDYMLEVVNTGETSIYDKMRYYRGQLLFLLNKSILWGLDHYYPFNYIVLTPYGEQADISLLSGLMHVNKLLSKNPWFRLLYYNRSVKILTRIHELAYTFLTKRKSPIVGTPATLNVLSVNPMSLHDYYHYIVLSRVIYSEIPPKPSSLKDLSWIPVILSIEINLIEVLNRLKQINRI